MSKKDLLDRDICTKYITPALTMIFSQYFKGL